MGANGALVRRPVRWTSRASLASFAKAGFIEPGIIRLEKVNHHCDDLLLYLARESHGRDTESSLGVILARHGGLPSGCFHREKENGAKEKGAAELEGIDTAMNCNELGFTLCYTANHSASGTGRGFIRKIRLEITQFRDELRTFLDQFRSKELRRDRSGGEDRRHGNRHDCTRSISDSAFNLNP